MTKKNFSSQIKTYLKNQFNLPDEQIESMIPEFKKTLAGHMEKLRAVNGVDNLAALEKAAHTIKGAFLNLGLAECAELASKIEHDAAQGNEGTDYDALVGRIAKFVDEIMAES